MRTMDTKLKNKIKLTPRPSAALENSLMSIESGKHTRTHRNCYTWITGKLKKVAVQLAMGTNILSESTLTIQRNRESIQYLCVREGANPVKLTHSSVERIFARGKWCKKDCVATGVTLSLSDLGSALRARAFISARYLAITLERPFCALRIRCSFSVILSS